MSPSRLPEHLPQILYPKNETGRTKPACVFGSGSGQISGTESARVLGKTTEPLTESGAGAVANHPLNLGAALGAAT
jgi:hypothetical protein